MTPQELSDKLKAEIERGVAACQAVADRNRTAMLALIDQVAALDASPLPADDHWLMFPTNYRPIKATGEFRDYGGFYTWEHEGIDFSMPVGVPIFACASGMVIFAWVKDGYGNCVRLEHLHNGKKWWTWYGHLSAIGVKVGRTVVAGETVGASGNTGNTTGAHLHLTVQREDCDFQPKGCTANLKGVVNPRDWLQWPV